MFAAGCSSGPGLFQMWNQLLKMEITRVRQQRGTVHRPGEVLSFSPAMLISFAIFIYLLYYINVMTTSHKIYFFIYQYGSSANQLAFRIEFHFLDCRVAVKCNGFHNHMRAADDSQVQTACVHSGQTGCDYILRFSLCSLFSFALTSWKWLRLCM